MNNFPPEMAAEMARQLAETLDSLDDDIVKFIQESVDSLAKMSAMTDQFRLGVLATTASVVAIAAMASMKDNDCEDAVAGLTGALITRFSQDRLSRDKG